MYAAKPLLAYEIYERAKLFGQNPSDCALLDECVTDIGRFYFDRGIWAWGKHVTARLEQAGQSNNASLARWQREREWERLMGTDTTDSSADFRAVDADSISPNARVVGEAEDSDDDDLVVLD